MFKRFINVIGYKLLLTTALLSTFVGLIDILSIAALYPLLNNESILLESVRFEYLILFFTLLIILKNVLAIYLRDYIGKLAVKKGSEISKSYLMMVFDNNGFLTKEAGEILLHSRDAISRVLLTYLVNSGLLISEMVFLLLALFYMVYNHGIYPILIILIFASFMLVMLRILSKRSKSISSRMKNVLPEYTDLLKQFWDTRNTIYLFGDSNAVVRDLEPRYRDIYNLERLSRLLGQLPARVSETLLIVMLLFVVMLNGLNRVEIASVLVLGMIILKVVPSITKLFSYINGYFLHSWSIPEVKTKIVTAGGVTLTANKAIHISTAYVDLDIVDGIDKQKINVLRAPSGYGKTTVFKTLAGVIDGNASQDEKIRDNALIKFRKTDIAWMDQSSFIWHMKSSDLVQGFLFGSPRASYFLNRYGLGELIERDELNSAQLSGGQKTRLNFIRCLCSEKTIFFFDEPSTGLEEVYIQLMIEDLNTLNKDDIIIFLITHDVRLISGIKSPHMIGLSSE